MAESSNKKLLELALDRFKRASDAVSRSRELQKADVRFALGSPDNGWQWDETDKLARSKAARPCLTINKIPLHLAQVTNDARQSPPGIKVRPVDDKADAQTAEIFNGVIRHIEANSDADVAYNTALEGATRSGEGFIRVVTEYADDDSFEQDIYIKRVPNPFTVYWDPSAHMPDASDGEFWFIEDWLTDAEFKAQFPKAKPGDFSFPAETIQSWKADGKVRIAEYFYKKVEDKTLYLWADGSVSLEAREGEEAVRSRPVKANQICWAKLTSDSVLETGEWAGDYWPIVRVPGNDDEVDGEKVISGIVRNAKDAQRMYNYWVSQEAEFLSLWTKAPYIAAEGAIEGFEDQWATANTVNRSVLPYNHIDDQGNPIPMPQRVPPPVPPSGIIQAKVGAADDIKSATGQFDASLGQKSNETSGKAIMARQREGDTATYHYIDNLSKAVRQLGRILVDLIPKIYDTARIARVLGEDGEVDTVQVDPSQAEAVTATRKPDGSIERIYNLGVGKYDVVSTVGPSFTTKRQEAVEAMTELTQANPGLWGVVGDLLVRNMDWPGADEMAKRLKATIPPNILQASEDKDEVDPEQMKAIVGQMQQQIQEAEQVMQQLAEENKELQAQYDLKAQELEVKRAEIGLKQQQAAAVTHKSEIEDAKLLLEEEKLSLERDKALLEHQIELQELEIKKWQAQAAQANVEREAQERTYSDEGKHKHDAVNSVMGNWEGMMAQVTDAIKTMGAPRAVVRDEHGRIIGTRNAE